jgi:hypothetical protein
MLKRRRQKQTISFQGRLAEWAEKIREQAARLPPGIERDEMLKRASQADIAAHLDDWANSRGLQPPT